MKYLIITLVLMMACVSLPLNAAAQTEDAYTVQYQINKPYCLLNFMETLKTNGYYGPTLYKYYKDSTLNDNETLVSLVNQYRQLNTYYSYEFGGYPKYRFMAKGRSTRDLFYTLSAKTETLDEFRQMTVGIIPYEKHQKFFKILEEVEPLYDELIWKPYHNKAQKKLRELKKYTNKINMSEKLQQYENFFNNSWPVDIPIVMSFSIVPGDIVRSVPPPQGNVVYCGLLTDSDDYSFYIGLLTHEMAHRSFAEQTLEQHQQIDQWFNDSKSPHKHMVNFMFNEILGGTVGHKIREDLIGPHESNYDQSSIRDFNDALYPMVCSYLDDGKSIDKNFVEKSLEIYGETFPKAHMKYDNLLQTYYLLTDATDYSISRAIRKNIASPMMYEKEKTIMNDEKIDKMVDYDFTKLVVISKDHEKTVNYLKNKIPELETYNELNTDSDFVLSFNDTEGKAYIIINIHSMDRFAEVLEKLKERKTIEADSPLLNLG